MVDRQRASFGTYPSSPGSIGGRHGSSDLVHSQTGQCRLQLLSDCLSPLLADPDPMLDNVI
jgi:hypothetical protein